MVAATTTQAEAPIRDERARYFRDNQFGDDGGYGDRWVRITVGPLQVAIPNTEGRVRAVRYHDLHHILTGYATDLRGEAEIAAWELATGCLQQPAAWLLNLHALLAGLVLDPRAMLAAFARGRRTDNLYGEAFDDALLDTPVGVLRQRLGLDRPEEAATAADRRAFAGAVAIAALVGAAEVAAVVAPLALLARALAG